MVHITETEPVPRPFFTLILQLQAQHDLAGDHEVGREALLQVLIPTIQNEVGELGEDTAFRVTGSRHMQCLVDAINTGHDLTLTIEDLQRAYSPRGLARALYTQLYPYMF